MLAERLAVPIHSLAYYRVVLQRLSDDHLQPDYVGYIRLRPEGLRIKLAAENPKPRLQSHNLALCGRRKQPSQCSVIVASGLDLAGHDLVFV